LINLIKNLTKRKKAYLYQSLGSSLNLYIGILSNIVLIPLYIENFDTRLYGIWISVGGVLSWLYFLDLGLGSVLTQRVSKLYGEKKIDKILSESISGIIPFFFSSLVFIIFGYILSAFIPYIFNLTETESKKIITPLLIVIFATSLNFINTSIKACLNGLLMPLHSSLITAFSSLIGFVLTIIFVNNGYDILSISYGLFISSIIALVFLVYFFIRKILPFYNKKFYEIKLILKYLKLSPIFIISRFAKSASKDIDLLFITLLINPELTVIFMTSKRIFEVMFNGFNILGNSLLAPMSNFIAEHGVTEQKKLFSKIFRHLFIVSLIGFFILSISHPLIISYWINNSFNLNYYVILLFGVAFFLSFLLQLLIIYLNSLGEFIISSCINIIEPLFRAFFIFIFIYLLGIELIPIAYIVAILMTLILFFPKFKNFIYRS
jgi:O-antigen/teichoic acid export membrane protein